MAISKKSPKKYTATTRMIWWKVAKHSSWVVNCVPWIWFSKDEKGSKTGHYLSGQNKWTDYNHIYHQFGRKCSLSSVNILLFPVLSGLTMAYSACGLLYGKWRYVYSSFCGNDEEGKGGDLPTALLVPNPSLEISYSPQSSSTEKIVGGGQLSRQKLSPKPANYHTYGLKTFRLPSHS